MKTITLPEYHALLKAQGVPRFHLAMVCVICGTIQSPADFIAAGAGRTFDEVEGQVGFSCIGRWTNAGPHQKDEPPGRGCDWTLGGLLNFSNLVVITTTPAGDETRHPRFEVATPEQAQAHMLKPRIYREQRCRKCGCIEEDCSQCIKKTGQPCSWVEEDLCSACVE